MPVVLHLDGPPELGTILPKIGLAPYRTGGGDPGETFKIDASTAGFGEVPLQVEQAVAFLKAHWGRLSYLCERGDVRMALDFGVGLRDVAIQVDRLPLELIERASRLRMEILWSIHVPTPPAPPTRGKPPGCVG